MKNLLLALALALVATHSFAAPQVAMECVVNKFVTLQVVRDGKNTALVEYTVGQPQFTTPLNNGRTYVEVLGPIAPNDDMSLWILKQMRIDPRVVTMTKFAQIDAAGAKLVTFHMPNGMQVGGAIVAPYPERPSFCIVRPVIPPAIDKRFFQ